MADPDGAPAELTAPDGSGAVEGGLPAGFDPTGGADRATVALVYGRTVYGALTLHTDREGGAGERESLDISSATLHGHLRSREPAAAVVLRGVTAVASGG